MAVTATYPNGILPWTPRVDNKDTVYAADPNQLAAEIAAIEGTLGTNPHIETYSPLLGGAQVIYSNVSARIHDVQMGNQVPYCGLWNLGPFYTPQGGVVPGAANTVEGYRNSYGALTDVGGFFNGTDITIPVDGVYIIQAYEQLGWAPSGFAGMHILVGGVNGSPQYIKSQEIFSWDFPENKGGANSVWGFRPRYVSTTYGPAPLSKGTRVSVSTWNVTPWANMYTDSAGLNAVWLRG